MLIKIAILFLGGMVLVGMVGRFLFPGAMRRLPRPRAAATCPRCGRYVIGKGGCDCGAPKGG